MAGSPPDGLSCSLLSVTSATIPGGPRPSTALFFGGGHSEFHRVDTHAQCFQPVDSGWALWLLDTSANISMEPFRAFVGDLLPPSQRTQGFAMQSLFIGLGSVIASILPWLLTHILRLDHLSDPGAFP
jgi:hypothetical protein